MTFGWWILVGFVSYCILSIFIDGTLLYIRSTPNPSFRGWIKCIRWYFLFRLKIKRMRITYPNGRTVECGRDGKTWEVTPEGKKIRLSKEMEREIREIKGEGGIDNVAL